MEYKLIAIDMDGTLLNSNHEISKRTINAIENAKEKGVQIVISTGRVLKSALHYADSMKLNNHIVACNGALILDNKRKFIYKKPINHELVKRVMEIGKELQVYFHFYDEETFYTNKYIKEIVDYYNPAKSKLKGQEIKFNLYENDEEVLGNKDLNVYKFLFIENDAKKLKRLREELSTWKDLNISSSWNNNVEVMLSDVSKGASLQFLCSELNIKSENVIAIGDNENDLSMINFAGLGVAMGNGDDKVKNSADYITDTNDKDGVAKVIEKFILDVGVEK